MKNVHGVLAAFFLHVTVVVSGSLLSPGRGVEDGLEGGQGRVPSVVRGLRQTSVLNHSELKEVLPSAQFDL